MSTATFEDQLRTRLHAAVDTEEVSLGASPADLVGRAQHRSRVTAIQRSLAAVAVVAVLAGGVWWGSNRYGNLVPSHRQPAETVTLLSESGTGADQGPVVQVVVDDQLVFRTRNGTELGRLPKSSTSAWAQSKIDPRVRFGVVPANTSLPFSWGPTWFAASSAAPLSDGRFAFALRFDSPQNAGRAAASVATVTSDGQVARLPGKPLPSVVIPNVGAFINESTDKTIFVDAERSVFGWISEVSGGPLGTPQFADEPPPAVPIGVDGAGLMARSRTNEFDSTENGTVHHHRDPGTEVFGVVPATAIDIRLVGPKGPAKAHIATFAIPGTRYLALTAWDVGETAPPPLASARTVSWVDSATGKRLQYTGPRSTP